MIPVSSLEIRLAELRAEFAAGDKAIRGFDGRREQLLATMMRIGGAIQVLEELLDPTPAASGAASGVPAGNV